MIYLDHNATTPLDPRVLDAMLPFLQKFYGNPSSLYRLGRVSRSAIETAREQVAALVNCHPDEIIFTSGGTEANNLAIKGLATAATGTWAAGATEHPAVLEIERSLKPWALQRLPVDATGIIQPDDLGHLGQDNVRFASIMWANNETGAINNIPALASRLNEAGIPLHTDAVQAVGKIPVDFRASQAFSLALSGHKFYGPKGSGALICKSRQRLTALINGGGQEWDLRSGTENVPAIVGLGKAAELAKLELAERMQHYQSLKQSTIDGLRGIPGVSLLNNMDDNHLANTILISCEGIDGEMLLMLLDKYGIAASSGSACASGTHQASHVLTAMGIPESTALGAARISFGKDNTPEQSCELLKTLKKICSERRA